MYDDVHDKYEPFELAATTTAKDNHCRLDIIDEIEQKTAAVLSMRSKANHCTLQLGSLQKPSDLSREQSC